MGDLERGLAGIRQRDSVPAAAGSPILNNTQPTIDRSALKRENVPRKLNARLTSMLIRGTKRGFRLALAWSGTVFPGLLIGVMAFGQTSHLDVATFVPPPGWKAEEGNGRLSFSQIENSSHSFCIISVYASVPSSGRLEQDFINEWKSVVLSAFTAPSTPLSSLNENRNGLIYRESGASVTQGKDRFYVHLMVFPAGNRVMNVVLIASSLQALTAREAAIETFLGTLKISGAGESAPPAPAVTDSPLTAQASPDGLTGVWMGYRPLTGSFTPQPRWVTFYEDGQVYENIPREGLLGFSREASMADPGQKACWGTYTFDGASGAITRAGTQSTTEIKAERPGVIKLDGTNFYRCRPVDGLVLDGAWTSFSDSDDPALRQLPQGKRPILRFTTDGRFSDEGIFATQFSASDPQQDAPGSGNYQILDFTLILKYSDGRKKHLALTAALGGKPTSREKTLYLGRISLSRMSR